MPDDNTSPPLQTDGGDDAPKSGRGGYRPNAGRPPKTPADIKRQKGKCDALASSVWIALESGLVKVKGDRWGTSKEERENIVDALGDCLQEWFDEFPATIRLGIVLTAYAGTRVDYDGLIKKRADDDDAKKDGDK